MKSKQVMFFAVFEDIKQILQDIEVLIDICYYKAGMFDDKNIPAYNSIFDSHDIGFVSYGDWNKINSYLVLNAITSLNIRDVPQRTGGVKFAVDQMKNPKSIELKLGGVYKGKDNVIVAGRVSTISEDSDSENLYKVFSEKFKKKFNRIGAFYVGQIAERKLNEGWRLVTNEKLPKEYDLKLS